MLFEKILPNLPYLKKQLNIVTGRIQRYADEVTYPREVLKVSQTVPISIINYLLGMELKAPENNIVNCCVVNDLICRSISYIDDVIDKSSVCSFEPKIDSHLKEVYRLAYGIGFLEVLYHALHDHLLKRCITVNEMNTISRTFNRMCSEALEGLIWEQKNKMRKKHVKSLLNSDYSSIPPVEVLMREKVDRLSGTFFAETSNIFHVYFKTDDETRRILEKALFSLGRSVQEYDDAKDLIIDIDDGVPNFFVSLIMEHGDQQDKKKLVDLIRKYHGKKKEHEINFEKTVNLFPSCKHKFEEITGKDSQKAVEDFRKAGIGVDTKDIRLLVAHYEKLKNY